MTEGPPFHVACSEAHFWLRPAKSTQVAICRDVPSGTLTLNDPFRKARLGDLPLSSVLANANIPQPS
jgi:hypothetical protein